MEIVAQVFDWKITRTELDFEENQIKKEFPDAVQSEIRAYAINNLIDRYLLMQEAINNGICIDDEEFEDALFDLLDYIESPDAAVLVNRQDRGEQLERVLKSNLIIQKFIESLDVYKGVITDEKLLQFYQERKEFFNREEEVRASHILIKGKDEATLQRIQKIRDCINCTEDFADVSIYSSDCPSGVNCGDLGYFPKGRMIPEIDAIAFSLKINEISQPFLTRYGYHILMVTDKKPCQVIPFEEIRDCLKASLVEIEQELAKGKILTEVRKRCQNEIEIFDYAFQ